MKKMASFGAGSAAGSAIGGLGSMGGAGGFSSGGMGAGGMGAGGMGAGGMGAGGMGAGGMGAGGMGAAFGGGAPSAIQRSMSMGAPSALGGGGGGGFQYGMAGGASTFGAPAAAGPPGFAKSMAYQPPNLSGGAAGGGSGMFGAPSMLGGAGGAGSLSNNLSFGGASQFGSMGGPGQAPSTGSMAAASNDPYANTAIDLNKVKVTAVAAKPFEKKSEEEKMQDAEKRGSIKSNLKTTKDDFKKAEEKGKKEVRFGRSSTYTFDNSDDDEKEDFNNENVTGKGSPRPSAKVPVSEVDLSDGRDEKEKAMKAMEDDEKR